MVGQVVYEDGTYSIKAIPTNKCLRFILLNDGNPVKRNGENIERYVCRPIEIEKMLGVTFKRKIEYATTFLKKEIMLHKRDNFI